MIDVASLVSEFLEHKASLGHARRTHESCLADFQRFFIGEGLDSFTEESVLPWCRARDAESAAGFSRRLVSLREFSKYMNAMGVADYIIPRNLFPAVRRSAPCIFTDEELARLFEECDKERACPANPCRHLIVPVVFRLIYFCGLRPNEGRELMRADFDRDAGTLLIRKNKTGKERLIPVSDDVANMPRTYLEQSMAVAPDAEALLPSATGKPYGRRWLGDTFARLWRAIRPERAGTAHVYDLGHRFATTVFARWLDEGADLGARLPCLSAYMGHASFSDTAYYIHLLPERPRSSPAVDWNRLNALIPEVPHED